MKDAWIKQHVKEFSVDSMCRFMTVSQSAYYAWLHRVQTTREKDDIELTTVIRDVFGKSRATYGTRRIQKSIVNRDRTVSRSE